MCGAAYLSALAAYRTGAGLVKLLTVEENRQILQERLPEAVIVTYTADQLISGREEFKRMIEEQMNWADVVVLGPGLGSEPYVEYLVEDILTSAFVPVIIDADGLNAIAGHPYLTTYYTENIVITPHLGEMARLTAGQADRLAPRPEGGEEAGGVGLAPHAVVEQQGIRRLHLGQGQKAGEQGVIARPPGLGREPAQILAGPAAQLRLLSRGSGRHGRPAGRPPPP